MPVKAIKNTAGRFNDLAVPRPAQFLWPTAALRMVCQLFHVAKDALDQIRCRNGIFQCNVIGDGIQITESRF